MTDQKKSQDPPAAISKSSEAQSTSNDDQSSNQPSHDQQTSLIEGDSTTPNVQEGTQAHPPSITNTQATGTTEAEYQPIVNIFDFYHNSSDFELQAPGASNDDQSTANTDPSSAVTTNPQPASSIQPLTGPQLHDAIEQELGFGPRASSLEYHNQNVGPGGYLDPSQPLTTQQATVSHPVIQRVVAGLQQQQPTVVQQATPAGQNVMTQQVDPRRLCICLGTHIGGNMVRCANNDCPKRWFHQECVGTQPIDWLCPVCKQVRPNTEAFGTWRKNT